MGHRDLHLNSLDRYVKSSPRFVLEEHSHCEVPAGCGGVVLRWRDPVASVPVQLWLAVHGVERYEVRLDGERPASGRPLLAPGTHVIVIAMQRADELGGFFLFAAVDGESENRLVLSGASTRWAWTPDEPPGEAWTQPEPVLAGWRPLSPATLDEAEEDYAMRRLTDLGATPLALPPGGVAWIRAVFELPSRRQGAR